MEWLHMEIAVRQLPSREPAVFFGFEKERSRCRKLIERLSPGERKVLDLLVCGEGSKGIARRLGLSERTVTVHRSSLIRKLDGSCAADAVRIALYAGL